MAACESQDDWIALFQNKGLLSDEFLDFKEDTIMSCMLVFWVVHVVDESCRPIIIPCGMILQ